MCSNVVNLRRRLREQEGGSGDGSAVDNNDHDFTILFEMGNAGILTGQYPVLMRVTVSSVFVIILLLLSHQFTLASFLFDIAKPVYIVYIGGIAIVELLSPALKKLDGWLGVPGREHDDTQDEIEVFSESVTSQEPTSNMSDGDKDSRHNQQSFPSGTAVSTREDDNGNNNLESTANINDSPANCLSNEHNNNSSFVRKSTSIPAPTNHVRKLRTRGRPGKDTDVELLRTLEMELRKERDRSSSVSQSREAIGRASKIPNMSKK